MIVFKRKGIRFGEVYYTTPSSGTEAIDILRVVSSEEICMMNAHARKSHTLVIDLSHDHDRLFAEMDKNTKYEIRRSSSKDNVVHKFDDQCSELEIDRFSDYYDEFAVTKNLKPVFRPRLKLLAGQKMLALTSVLTNEGKPLVWHSYLLCDSRVALLYSASHFRHTDDARVRNLAGRANRYAHWNDILKFKEKGFLLYDMGGIDATGKSEETQRIALFKRGFGGSIVPVYQYTVPTSILGQMVCGIAKIMRLAL